MAEGHAVARWADALQQLVGASVREIRVPPRWRERADRLRNQRVTRVHTHGKHLVIHFANDWVIHTHAMQYGSWQIGPIGQTLRKDPRYARLRITTDDLDVLFYHGPVMEILSAPELAQHEKFTTLGPDLLHAEFAAATVWPTLHTEQAREVGDAILDQRIVAGIGNIYKSEGLFLATIHPKRRADSVTPRELEVLFAELIPLMQAARLEYGMTITLPRELRYEPWMRNWVYRRRGQPCFVCATPIEMFRQGDFQRTTYFCPHCQPLIGDAARHTPEVPGRR